MIFWGVHSVSVQCWADVKLVTHIFIQRGSNITILCVAVLGSSTQFSNVLRVSLGKNVL